MPQEDEVVRRAPLFTALDDAQAASLRASMDSVKISKGAYVSAWVGTRIAKTLKVTIFRGPLSFLDSVLGAVFEIAKYVILFYVIGTILLWAPWPTGQNAVAESKFYLQVNEHAPSVITEIREAVEKALANPRL